MNNFNLSKAAYSVNEVLAILPLKRTSLYKAINSNQLKATKFGNKTIFLVQDIVDFLQSLPAINGGSNVAK